MNRLMWILGFLMLFSLWGAVAWDESDAGDLIQVKVKQGDTLWTIARVYGGPDRDVRRVVEEIRELNRMPGADIYPGQILKVPVYER